MTTAPKTEKRSRIQRKNRKLILEAALDVFSAHGYRGSTLDQIAEQSGLSKPNILYYFQGKEAIYQHLLANILASWLEPLEAIDRDGDAVEEIIAYVQTKLALSQQHPRQSRLFANEILQGARRISQQSKDELKVLVEATAEKIRAWIEAGRLASVDPYHLLFSIWASTQHYADFESQITMILGQETLGNAQVGALDEQTFEQAHAFLDMQFRRLLTP